MRAIKVEINGREICRAGYEAYGSVVAMIDWGNVDAGKVSDGTQAEPRIKVSGLQVDAAWNRECLVWLEHDLSVGDEITLIITEAESLGQPVSSISLGPLTDVREELDRVMYQILKAKYEPELRAAQDRESQIMRGFEVYVNGRRCCVAGYGAHGSVISTVMWGNVQMTMPPSLVAESGHSHVAGNQTDADGNRDALLWFDQDLAVGDEVTVKIIETQSLSEPLDSSSLGLITATHEAADHALYQRLKSKYEGPHTP